jgi:hypothetical protein
MFAHAIHWLMVSSKALFYLFKTSTTHDHKF